jgi:hypothetical protein
MTFQPSSSNGARLRLIEINGVLFAVLKRRAQQKSHRPPPGETPGLSSDTALYPHKNKKLLEIPNEQIKRTKTSRLEKPEGVQLHHN